MRCGLERERIVAGSLVDESALIRTKHQLQATVQKLPFAADGFFNRAALSSQL